MNSRELQRTNVLRETSEKLFYEITFSLFQTVSGKIKGGRVTLLNLYRIWGTYDNVRAERESTKYSLIFITIKDERRI